MLTDTQKANARRWMGYPAFGTDTSVAPYVYLAGIVRSHELEARLVTLSAAEETVLIASYLDPLATLETAILAAQDNLDTNAAGPWVGNPREIQQRTSLFNQWRRNLCDFLGYAPGPGLQGAVLSVVRA